MGPSRSGLSKSFVTTVGRVRGSAARQEKTGNTVKKNINRSRKAIQREEADKLRYATNFNLDAREALDAMEGTPEHSAYVSASLGETPFDDNDDDDIAEFRVPYGDEGEFNLFEPQEHLEQGISTPSLFKSRRYDYRTRRDRIQKENEAWQGQMKDLERALLDYRSNGTPQVESGDPASLAWKGKAVSLGGIVTMPVGKTSGYSTTNTILLRHGYLGSSPTAPQTCFSISLLHLFRQLVRACPRMSASAFCKALHFFHLVPVHTHLEKQFRQAYDVYRILVRSLNVRVRKACGQHSEKERLVATCPPCFNRLDDEKPLHPAVLLAMDGGNSLKSIDEEYRSGSSRTDLRQVVSSRFVPSAEVDLFKDDVKKSHTFKAPNKQPVQSSTEDIQMDEDTSTLPDTDNPDRSSEDPRENTEPLWLNITETDQELQGSVNACVEHWRAASPDARKRMLALFAVSGIFLVVCRHGHVLLTCDMIRSGELMKYPLSLVNRLLDTVGKDMCIGYDIMCSFIKTLQSSSIGRKAVLLNVTGVVPAFHGFAHRRSCQVWWHPMYARGVGLEDFEECERTFSLSNLLASTTRLATTYHRRIMIEDFFDFHDIDKHTSSGIFIFKNYRQALERLEEEKPRLSQMCLSLNLSHDELEEDLEEERKFIAERSKDEDRDYGPEYVAMLQELGNRQAKAIEANTEFLKLTTAEAKKWSLQKIASVRAAKRTFANSLKLQEEAVLSFEHDESIEHRWLPQDEKYIQSMRGVHWSEYLAAVQKIERLVVKRFFEMEKLNMANVGYKQREKIGKALRTRATAIVAALKVYNKAAAALRPPGRHLDFQDLLDMAASGEFELLGHPDSSLEGKAWVSPARREAGRLYFRIKRAEEEIYRLNVEIQRLVTFMFDEDLAYLDAALAAKEQGEELFASELERIHVEVASRSQEIARSLKNTSRLQGFTGSIFPGFSGLQTKHVDWSTAPLPPWASIELGFIQITSVPNSEEASAALLRSSDLANPAGTALSQTIAPGSDMLGKSSVDEVDGTGDVEYGANANSDLIDVMDTMSLLE